MAEPGAVGWQFSRKGVIIVDGAVAEDEVMMAALDAGADDVARADDVAWCLAWLDRLRSFVAQHGRGIDPHLGDIDDVIDAAAAMLRGRQAPVVS